MVDKWIVTVMGCRMHYALPRLLYRANALSCFFTDICAEVGWPRLTGLFPGRCLPSAVRRLKLRRIEDVPRRLIRSFNCFGMEYQMRRRMAQSSSELTAVHLWAGERFCNLVLRSQLELSTGLYCLNSAGFELLKRWREIGYTAVVEQTIVPRRIEEQLLRDEESAYPGWQPPLPRDTHVDRYIEREEAEWRLARRIVCGSEFVRDGIAQSGGPVDRCVVVPYGVPREYFRPVRKSSIKGRALRILTIGTVGLRKGSHYVVAAAKILGPRAEFRLVGPSELLPGRMREARKVLELTGAVPRGDVHRHFDWADLFLLPSLCEGSATVTYEALSAGLPVIATPNAGSIVEHGMSGFIIPHRDADAIVRAVQRFLFEPSLLVHMSASALDRATEGSLEAYANRLLEVLSE